MSNLTPGSDQCRCSACGLHFKSAAGFTFHRRGDYTREAPNFGRYCLTPAELTAKGYTPNARGFWRKARPDVSVMAKRAA